MVYRKISSNALKNYFWNINFSETCYVKSFKYCNVVIIVSFCYYPGRICIARGSWHFGDFRNIFLPNIGEDQQKVLPFERGGP